MPPTQGRQVYVCGSSDTPGEPRCGFHEYKEMLDYVTDKCSGDYPICCGEKPKVYVETRPTKNWGNLIMHCKNGSEKWHKDPSNGYLGYTVVSNRPPPVEWAYNNEVFPNVREQVEIARRKRGEATQLEISSL